ncbi:MAG: hypothetical protein KY467_08080 [Gemmatimonadetes bacterium]|nr:hypothetical protein [Gemmatimonadota bacterium]
MPNDINRPTQIGGQRVAITFFPDGRVLMREPPEGLAAPLRRTDAPNWSSDWGTYEVVGGRELRVRVPGHVLRGCWDGRLLRIRRGSRRAVYRPWPRLSGTLNGAYRADASLPAIHFTPDGTFVDEGFQQYLGDRQALDGGIRFADQPQERQARRAGRGTYSLRDNTLELRYADGRVERLTAMATPEEGAVRPLPRVYLAGREHARVAGASAPNTPAAGPAAGRPPGPAARSSRCDVDAAATRSNAAAGGIYFSLQPDGGVTAITLLPDGTLVDGRPLPSGLADAARVAAAVAERRRRAPAEVQRWAAAGSDGIVICGAAGRVEEMRVQSRGRRLTGALGTYLRAPEATEVRLDGVVWQASDVRDRFTAIQFTPDGRFQESNVARLLGLPGAPAGDDPRTGSWRLLGGYVLELRYDGAGRADHVPVLVDPFEHAAGRSVLYLGQEPFTPRTR